MYIYIYIYIHIYIYIYVFLQSVAQAATANSRVRHVASAAELSAALAAGRPVVLQFGSETCGFCTLMAPVFELLAEKYLAVDFVAVDLQQVPEAGDAFQIQGLPAFRAVVGGALRGAVDGADTPGLEALVAGVAREAGEAPAAWPVAPRGDPGGAAVPQWREVADDVLLQQLKALKQEIRRRAALHPGGAALRALYSGAEGLHLPCSTPSEVLSSNTIININIDIIIMVHLFIIFQSFINTRYCAYHSQPHPPPPSVPPYARSASLRSLSPEAWYALSYLNYM